MRSAALIYNPKAGRRRHELLLGRVLAELARGGFAVEVAPTAGPGDATRLARERAAAGAEVVLAFGGDGTVREVAAGLAGTSAGTGAALGILPGGTVNLLAQALGLPGHPVAAARALGALAPRPIDIGLGGSSPFLMMVSAGLDASLLATLDGELKGRYGIAGVAGHALASWWSYPYPALEVVADGRPLEATFAAVANIPYYAGPYRLVPGARWDDRRLDLLLFRGTGRRATLAFALDLLRSAHLRRHDVEILPVREEVQLRGPAGALAQIDGDVCPEPLPLAVRLAPEQLLVLAPSGVGSPDRP